MSTSSTANHQFHGTFGGENTWTFGQLLRAFVNTITSSDWSRRGPGAIRWAN
ncbi:hypothetical protein [Marinibacterium profundimaris]|uniref:hypothetical protein n=1 Tax=Marinibacterium profundimaris TaxID=1679460 RepID=UPI0013036B0D|nr:hypothetical protein [Marinibacterium profundimaris]